PGVVRPHGERGGTRMDARDPTLSDRVAELRPRTGDARGRVEPDGAATRPVVDVEGGPDSEPTRRGWGHRDRRRDVRRPDLAGDRPGEPQLTGGEQVHPVGPLGRPTGGE